MTEPISKELRPITDEMIKEFPGLVDVVSFPLNEDVGESAVEVIPKRFPKCPLLLIYSSGTYYVGAGNRSSYDSFDDYEGDDPRPWALEMVQRIARYGMYRVRSTSRDTHDVGTLWLPQDEGDFSRVFEDPKVLITIESMPWRGLAVRAN